MHPLFTVLLQLVLGAQSVASSSSVSRQAQGRVSGANVSASVGSSVNSQFFGMSLNGLSMGWPNQPVGALGKVDGTSWKWIETCDGGVDPSNPCYNWSGLDTAVAAAQAHNVTVLYTFDGMPGWATVSGSVNMPPASWQYLADFATAIATRYQGKIKYYEELNEPTDNAEWNGTYGQLVQYGKTVYQAIKAVDPAAQVGAPVPAIQVYQPSTSPTAGASDFVAWMQNYFAAGGAQYADFTGWHSYSCQIGEYGCNADIGCDLTTGQNIDCAGQGLYNQYDEYSTMLDNIGLVNIPLLNSEGGWLKDDGDGYCPNYATTACFVSILLQPAYVARYYILLSSAGANGTAGVQTAYWYQWGGTGGFDNNGWGTLNGTDGQSPLAGPAYGQVYDWLVGSTFTSRCSASGSVWTCPLSLWNSQLALIVWDASQSCAATVCGTSTFALPSAAYASYQDLAGNTSSIAGSSIAISAAPILLTGPPLPPAITPGGVVSAGLSSPAVTSLSASAIATVFGSNFAAPGTARTVGASDLVNGNLPTQLAGACVQVGGLQTPILSVSPSQINFQVPAVPSGSTSVQVINECGTPQAQASAEEAVTIQAASPEFFYFVHNLNGQNPIAAMDSLTGAYIGAPGLIAGATFSPAKSNEYLTLFATGFGPTNPSFGPGQLPAPGTIAPITNPYTVTVGGVTAQVLYIGVSQYPGLYQLNIQLPANIPDGNQEIIVNVGGFSSPAAAFITVQN